MKVLVLSNGEIKKREIGNDLKDLQDIVDGYIEIPFLSDTFFESGIDMIINEEGKFIEGLKPEIAIIENGTYKLLDIVYGNCIFASHDDEGEMVSLTEEQAIIVENELSMEVAMTDKNTGNSFVVKALLI